MEVCPGMPGVNAWWMYSLSTILKVNWRGVNLCLQDLLQYLYRVEPLYHGPEATVRSKGDHSEWALQLSPSCVGHAL